MNFLEQLIAEWYSFQGYFVRTNIKIGKRELGGYEGEMDVLAFDPSKRLLVHLEVSGDADSWKERRDRFRRKFTTAAEHYGTVFDFKLRQVKKVAVVGFSKPKSPIDFGPDIELILIPDMMVKITKEMGRLRPTAKAVPEGFPLLRAVQFTVWYGNAT